MVMVMVMGFHCITNFAMPTFCTLRTMLLMKPADNGSYYNGSIRQFQRPVISGSDCVARSTKSCKVSPHMSDGLLWWPTRVNGPEIRIYDPYKIIIASWNVTEARFVSQQHYGIPQRIVTTPLGWLSYEIAKDLWLRNFANVPVLEL